VLGSLFLIQSIVMDEKPQDLKKTQKQKLKKKSSLLISFYEYKVIIKYKN
tara:strand:- start:489 stop:638 length:150 start_codon:yes stop_codon:yes gene_type:complete